MKTIALLCVLLLSQNVFGISEKNYELNYAIKVLPFLLRMEEGTFTGQENISIHYRHYIQKEAKNCLMILPGRSEPVEKYAEVIYDLYQTPSGKNLNFFLLDHRGQGQSARMTSPSDMGHIDEFENYILDLETFMKLMKLGERCEHKFLLAHSMGAGIGTSFILKYPNSFEKVAFVSPMLKIQTGDYSYAVARAIVQAQNLIGRGDQFAIGQMGYNPDATFEKNKVTTSPARFKMSQALNDLYPKTRLGGVSNRFVLETMRGTNPLRSRYHLISAPLLVFTAGIENYSVPEEMTKLCSESANCRPSFFAQAKHEILMERDEFRDQVIKELENFFQ